MLKVVEATLKGTTAILMHSGRLANPLDKHSKAIKTISKKRNKTDAEYEELQRVEFLGGLYTDEDDEPCIPGLNALSCLCMGAAKRKKKTAFQSAVVADAESFKLIYNGPKKPGELWLAMKDMKGEQIHRFADIRRAVVGQASVMRCRARFDEWSAKLRFQIIDDREVDTDDVRLALEEAGRVVGLCDYTPQFGRFVVTEFRLV